jgi:hypothetical protein
MDIRQPQVRDETIFVDIRQPQVGAETMFMGIRQSKEELRPYSWTLDNSR